MLRFENGIIESKYLDCNPQFLSWRSNIDKLLIFQMQPVEHQEGMFISFNLQQVVNSGPREAFQCP